MTAATRGPEAGPGAEAPGSGARSRERGTPAPSEPGPPVGSALLVVVGATAALAVMAQLLLLASTTVWAILSFHLDREQAVELARAGLVQVDAGLRAGALTVPEGDAVVDVGGELSSIPSPPPGWWREGPRPWPPTTPEPPVASSPALGKGRAVLLRRVPGPDGEPRTVPVSTEEGETVEAALLEVRMVAWFRRATVETAGRFLVHESGLVRRLD